MEIMGKDIPNSIVIVRSDVNEKQLKLGFAKKD